MAEKTDAFFSTGWQNPHRALSAVGHRIVLQTQWAIGAADTAAPLPSCIDRASALATPPQVPQPLPPEEETATTTMTPALAAPTMPARVRPQRALLLVHPFKANETTSCGI